MAWLVANPLLMLCLYVFAFGVIFGGRFTNTGDETTLDYALGVFVGLNLLGLISGVIASTPRLIIDHSNFVKKVVFPTEILPAALVGALICDLVIGFLLSLVGIIFLGPGLTIACIYLPILFGPIFLMALGLALFFSSVDAFDRDLGQLGAFLSLCLLYSRGVFYSSEKAQEVVPAFWTILKWNPLLQLIDNFRSVLLLGQSPQWEWLGYCWIVGALIFISGAWVFQKVRFRFADIL